MTVVLKIDTKDSLYEPLEVVIDGKTLRVKEVTLGGLEEIQGLQSDLDAGSAAALKKMLSILVDGGDDELYRSIPISKLKSLVDAVVARSLNPSEAEKNAQRPGGESTPS